jgi:hypothetical protein
MTICVSEKRRRRRKKQKLIRIGIYERSRPLREAHYWVCTKKNAAASSRQDTTVSILYDTSIYKNMLSNEQITSKELRKNAEPTT